MSGFFLLSHSHGSIPLHTHTHTSKNKCSGKKMVINSVKLAVVVSYTVLCCVFIDENRSNLPNYEDFALNFSNKREK